MKLAITRRGFLTDVDGVNRFVFTLADGLNALGHDVHVLSYSCHDISPSNLSSFSQRTFDAEGKAKIHTLTGDVTTRPTWSKVALAWLLKGTKLLKDLDVDAIVMNGIAPIRSDAIRLAVNHGIFHGDFRFMTGLRRRFYLEMARVLYRYNVDAPVCVAPLLRRELEKYLGIEFLTVPLPVKLGLFHRAALESRGNEILHLGTRTEKNVEMSIRIIKMLREDKKIDAKLVVVGPENTHIKHLMEKYEHLTSRYVEFRLNISSSELRRLLARARVLLLPSRYEAFSYAVLEAFASGLPAVVSNAVPSELVLDGKNGFRVQDLQLRSYAARLTSLFTDSSLWKAISENAIETAKDYAHIRIAKKYEDIITKTLDKKHSAKVLVRDYISKRNSGKKSRHR